MERPWENSVGDALGGGGAIYRGWSLWEEHEVKTMEIPLVGGTMGRVEPGGEGQFRWRCLRGGAIGRVESRGEGQLRWKGMGGRGLLGGGWCLGARGSLEKSNKQAWITGLVSSASCKNILFKRVPTDVGNLGGIYIVV